MSVLIAISTLSNGQVYANEVNLNSSDIIITRIQTGSESSASAEVVEIYNAGSIAVDIRGWCVAYSAGANGITFVNKGCVSNPLDMEIILPPSAFISFYTTEFNAVYENPAHLPLSSGFSASSGHIRLVSSNNLEVDRVGWGSAVGSLEYPAPSTTALKNVLYRYMNEEGIFQNTRSNQNDFYVGVALPLTTYETWTDLCKNIEGSQYIVPEGYAVNNDGFCFSDPVVDDPDDDDDEAPIVPVEPIHTPSCEGIAITELLPNPAGTDASKEYIELWNSKTEQVNLKGCSLKTSANNKEFTFEQDEWLQPNEYKAYYNSITGLTLPNSGGGTAWLLAPNDQISEVVYAAGLADDVAWAQFSDGWFPTFALTPGQPNEYLALRPCAAGYERSANTNRCVLIATLAASLVPCAANQERNPETNRCRNVLTTATLTPCREGQYRSPDTNRCRNVESASTLVPCREGQERNPETNRCRNIVSTALADCGEGRERNPDTNRCRNVASASTTIEPYKVANTATPASTKTGWLIAGIVFVAAAGYGAYEWRHELGKQARRFIPGKK